MPRTPRRNSPCRRGRGGSISRRRSRSSTGPEAINWLSSASSSPILGSLTLLDGSTVSSSGGISSYENSDANSQFIIMNENGQTPDHLYLARTLKPTVGRTQVKRRLNLDTSEPNKSCFKTPKTAKKPSNYYSPKGKSPAEKTRYDTSLGLLTKKFVGLLQTAPCGVVDLNKASIDLDVQKRRIYDITNVLEGISLIEKKSKNNIQWKGAEMSNIGSNQYRELQSEIVDLQAKENQLDELIHNTTLQLQLLTDQDSRYAYVTYQDIRGIKSLKDQIVIAIKAPPETSLEVPNPEAGMQIWLKSKKGEIEVYLCPEDDPGGHSDNESQSSSGVEEIDPASDSQCSNGEVSLKQALISEQDDLGPMGSKSFLLQTEDQHTDMSFLTLEPPLSEEDYSFTLDEGEGLADLFDVYDFSDIDPIQVT